MNDERFLKDWLRDTTDSTADPNAAADRIVARLPETPQRRRWWPSLPGRRRTRPQPTDDDHPPTVSGRTRFMLSPVKAITAGALALALSAAFLVAQPIDRLEVAPGAEMEVDLAPPVEVSAKLIDLACFDGSTEPDGTIEREYGVTCKVYSEWSDPRFQGTETYIGNDFTYTDGSGVSVGHYVHDIVTDEGAWRMRPLFRFDSDSEDGPGDFSGTWVLDGEGAYEGLSVVLAKVEEDLHGYIVPTDMVPPAPERESAE